MGLQTRVDKTTNNDRGFRDAVLSTVHSELKNINKRSNEVVVTGLPPKVGVSDEDLFRDMCFSNLSIAINIVKTQRLGKDTGKVKPLMIAVDSHEMASKLIGLSKTLRSSPDPAIHDRVFINRHLTRAKASAALALRVQQRSKQQNSSAASQHNDQPRYEQGKPADPINAKIVPPASSTIVPGNPRGETSGLNNRFVQAPPSAPDKLR